MLLAMELIDYEIFQPCSELRHCIVCGRGEGKDKMQRNNMLCCDKCKEEFERDRTRYIFERYNRIWHLIGERPLRIKGERNHERLENTYNDNYRIWKGFKREINPLYDKPGVCKWCGKPLPPYSGRGAPRKYCNDKCRESFKNSMKQEKERETYYDFDKHYKGFYKFKTNDAISLESIEKYPCREHVEINENLEFDVGKEFNQDDRYWVLGQSGLFEHRIKNKDHEQHIVHKEAQKLYKAMDKLGNRKQKPKKKRVDLVEEYEVLFPDNNDFED